MVCESMHFYFESNIPGVLLAAKCRGFASVPTRGCRCSGLGGSDTRHGWSWKEEEIMTRNDCDPELHIEMVNRYILLISSFQPVSPYLGGYHEKLSTESCFLLSVLSQSPIDRREESNSPLPPRILFSSIQQFPLSFLPSVREVRVIVHIAYRPHTDGRTVALLTHHSLIPFPTSGQIAE